MRSPFVRGAVAAMLGVAAGCHHDRATGPGGFDTSFLGACGQSSAFFTALPFTRSDIMGWVPLGNLNPPGHTFPTDHQYIYLTSFLSGGEPAPLYAPGNVTILSAKVTRYSTGTPAEDYSLTFSPCAEVSAEFGHVRTVAAALLAQIGAMDQACRAYSPNPGLSVTQCYSKPVRVAVHAGDVIGTSAGLDLSMFDARVPAIAYANPSRWTANNSGFDHFHVVPFSDYYAEPLRATVQGMLGSFDGTVRRTVAPLGGSIASDVPGSLQGAWFSPSHPTYPETPHLAIAPSNVDPSRTHISMGTSQPGFPAGAYAVSAATGTNVNVSPSQLTPDSGIACYEFENGGIALVRLTDATTLTFEGRSGFGRTCAGERPWAFTAAAVVFAR
ncbi:MAG TPA: hypothetical protein VG916_05255 [Gemmatimonadaceae bacterium]|nr:hypothetical protein [Gemmatimonadaceae bacterium]